MKFRCRNKWIGIGFGAVVFLFFLIFFTKLHLIVISTTDDYFGFTNHRQAVPQWGGSEPTRVVGAVFMPLISQFMSFFFRIFGGNLFDYLTFGWGFCVAAAITGLVAVMYHLLVKSGVSSLRACAGLMLFLLMHFWIFKQRQQPFHALVLSGCRQPLQQQLLAVYHVSIALQRIGQHREACIVQAQRACLQPQGRCLGKGAHKGFGVPQHQLAHQAPERVGCCVRKQPLAQQIAGCAEVCVGEPLQVAAQQAEIRLPKKGAQAGVYLGIVVLIHAAECLSGRKDRKENEEWKVNSEKKKSEK